MSFSSRQCLVRWRLAYRRARIIRKCLNDYRLTYAQRDDLYESVLRRDDALQLQALSACDGFGDVLGIFEFSDRCRYRRFGLVIAGAGPRGRLP